MSRQTGGNAAETRCIDCGAGACSGVQQPVCVARTCAHTHIHTHAQAPVKVFSN